MKDYIIIGGGLAGTILADYLSKKADVLILDQGAGKHSSKIAAGIFNPVTGRRMTKSWMVDVIGPLALAYYQDHEKEGGQKLVEEKLIKRFFHNAQQKQEWLDRVEFQSLEGIIKGQIAPDETNPRYHMDFGGVETQFSWRLDTVKFLDQVHQSFRSQGILISQLVDYSDIEISDSHFKVGEYPCRQVIFAEGYKMIENPWFGHLPMAPNKGELLVIECDDLDETQLVQKRIFVLPIDGNQYKIGATYERDNLSLNPSDSQREWLVERLDKAIKVPYKIIGHETGIRPAIKDRRPLIGHHAEHKNLWVFNGFGSKGVSQIPWCAQQFVAHLVDGLELLEELWIGRFDK